MATILEGLNQIAEAVGGTAEAESNLEALNAISAALGGSADAENNADAIANIAENASGGGGGGASLNTSRITFQAADGDAAVMRVLSIDKSRLHEEFVVYEQSVSAGHPLTVRSTVSNTSSTSTDAIFATTAAQATIVTDNPQYNYLIPMGTVRVDIGEGNMNMYRVRSQSLDVVITLSNQSPK